MTLSLWSRHGVKQTAGGEYYATKNAKLGDLGSKTLKPYFSGAVWKSGSVVEVSLPCDLGAHRACPCAVRVKYIQ